jgi:hypothetical protein
LKEAPAARAALDQLLQPGLVERKPVATKHCDAGCVDADADHIVAEIGQTCCCGQAHVAKANHPDPTHRPGL